MHLLKDNDYKTFESICALGQKALKKTMATVLRSKYKRVIETPDYVIAEGDIPIALVAHLDTVFPKPAKEILYDRQKNVIWSPAGLGADDRAGVFAIIQIIRKGYRPHIIFTTDEETGAQGAMALGKEKCPFKDLRYMIELDRRGSNDCVFYDCDNPEFIKYVEKFGFAEAIGSFSDISVLMEDWLIAGVNLSIGYRDEHSISEVLFVEHMLNTIQRVCNMLDEKEIPKFEFIPYEYNSPYAFNWYRLYKNDYDKNKCWLCGQKFNETEMVPVKLKDNTIRNFCVDCIVDTVNWCSCCGEAFEADSNNKSRLCNDCRYEFFHEQY